MSPLKQPFKQSVLLSSLAALALLPLASCANTPWASQLENSLAADPQLQARVEASPTADPTAPVQLPANFPAEIPRYPNATLVAVSGGDAGSSDPAPNPASSDPAPNPASPNPASPNPTGTPGAALGENQPVRTRWQTSDAVEQVKQFYQTQFQTNGWQLSPTGTEANAALQASRDGLQVVVAAQPANGTTDLTIQYRFDNTVAASPSASPQPGDSGFVGPVAPSSPSNNPTASNSPGAGFADLGQAPAELQSYITDLAKLGLFANQANFNPNAEISRRQYALWLVEANNRIYANQPARKIRLASGSTDKPLFQDVPTSDPDFAAIQGLANAGLLPSSLTGDPTTTFRPDSPLTREELILWKVPADLRQALPNASVDSIQQTWGFQDAAKIDPKALRAVAADYQNGDLSNIRRAFGYTTLFQPQKTVSRAEAAAVLWQFGSQGNSLTAKDAAQITPAESPSPTGG